jgi:hypothetical protein
VRLAILVGEDTDMAKASVPTLIALTALLSLAAPRSTSAQQDGTKQESRKSEKSEKSIRDYFDLYTYDAEELHQYWQEAERRKQLIGPIGVGGYFIPAGLESGPYPGPPLQIWGRGFGTSLWRDPITGWAIQ